MSDAVKWFHSKKSGREIAINTNVAQLAVLRTPTYEEMDCILCEHEEAVIAECWEKKLAVKSSKGTYLEGFATSPSGSLKYFVHPAVNVHLGTPKIRGLAKVVHALTFEKQQILLESLCPTSRAEMLALATEQAANDLIGEDLRAELKATGDVAAFINRLYKRGSGPRQSKLVRSGGAEQSIEVLTMLWARGFILFPVQFRAWKSTVKWRAPMNPRYAGDMASLMNEVGSLLKASSPSQSFLGQSCLLMSSLKAIDDLSFDLIEAMEGVLTEVAERPGHARNIGAAFREMWAMRYPEEPFIKRRTEASAKQPELLRTSGDFGWLSVKNPHMASWQEPLAQFVIQREATSKQAVIADLNVFCDFLLEHPQPPAAPELVTRVMHIRDVTLKNRKTLIAALEKSTYNKKRRNRILGYLREFFGWYHDWLVGQGRDSEAINFKNPVSSDDNFGGEGGSAGQTHREALPSWLLRELRKTLVEDDFAFAKRTGSHDWNNLHNKVTGQVEKVWWPGTAIILTILLDLPLRSHQSRWLDSGEFDEFIFDVGTSQEIPNPNPRAIPGRREGCMR